MQLKAAHKHQYTAAVRYVKLMTMLAPQTRVAAEPTRAERSCFNRRWQLALHHIQ
jgi:hypothetical protein